MRARNRGLTAISGILISVGAGHKTPHEKALEDVIRCVEHILKTAHTIAEGAGALAYATVEKDRAQFKSPGPCLRVRWW
ncbi:MAG: hypothetical protein DVB23_002825 [Verrucomicrobia bacterium]|nr:MAG: hypothetical protein DVB23_002825 [Verrucomicrobiota bacterium]